ncbi:hypothetical protein ACE193_21270 [Bernardetia sp. OM2101]|uniref:hypothetical protein n=1 Tax=Bernardetia sp. OM2101 TaxID=3344876 RepID=UPI0035D04164
MLTKAVSNGTITTDIWMAAFIFGMLIIFFGILFLEWSELAELVKSIIKFIKPKKWNKQQHNSQ